MLNLIGDGLRNLQVFDPLSSTTFKKIVNPKTFWININFFLLLNIKEDILKKTNSWWAPLTTVVWGKILWKSMGPIILQSISFFVFSNTAEQDICSNINVAF